MTRPPTDTLRLLSALLQYPDEALLGSLNEIQAAAEDLPAGEMKTAIAAFVAYLTALAHAPIRLQERYTAAFDMRPATTLNLTYHAYGDNENRAAAMARLQHVYAANGWERTSTDLPDYLPLMLEFLSLDPPPGSAAPVWECLKGLAALVERLEGAAPAYAALLQPLARAAAGPSPSPAPTPA